MTSTACWSTSQSQAARHRPRDGGGHYSSRELPEELQDSQEAADVWAAARAATPSRRMAYVNGWRIEWRPRQGAPVGKRGDLYIFPPNDEAGGGWGRPIRSLSALHDVLLLRMAAKEAGASVWSPPMRGSLVEVRLGAGGEDEEVLPAGDEGDEIVWRRAEVRRVEPGLGGSFQVVVHDAAGEPDEEATRWCTAWNECAEWRRIDGQPLFARNRPGKRTRRCGQCAGCVALDCGQCSACLDKPKFGGKGTAKQACSKRRCAKPTMPADYGTTADGGGRTAARQRTSGPASALAVRGGGSCGRSASAKSSRSSRVGLRT